MALVSCKLRIASGHARLVFADGRCADLEAEPFDRLCSAARPLLELVAARGAGRVRALSVNLRARVLRATCETGRGVTALRIDGERFAREIAPLCDALSR